jgi:hypothetical protein
VTNDWAAIENWRVGAAVGAEGAVEVEVNSERTTLQEPREQTVWAGSVCVVVPGSGSNRPVVVGRL